MKQVYTEMRKGGFEWSDSEQFCELCRSTNAYLRKGQTWSEEEQASIDSYPKSTRREK